MVTYYQATKDQSACRAAFSREDASCTDVFYVKGEEMVSSILDLLGDCEAQGGGWLTRTLPKAHPQYPWLYASTVDIQGMGQTSFKEGLVGQLVDVEDTEVMETAVVTEQFWQHSAAALQVKFQPRPYAVLADDFVTMETATVYDTDRVTYEARWPEGEWLRFTDYEVLPAPELITAQQGLSFFIRDDTPIKGAITAAPPHGYSFQGFPRIYLNKSAIKFTWYQVPWRYVTHARSFIVAGIGRVNQLDWYNWKKGELLYLGCQVKRYTPPVPLMVFDSGLLAPSTEKLCDITFLFDRVIRTQTSVPETMPNDNDVTAGHNLMPWFGDRQTYYAIYPGVPALIHAGTAAGGGASTITLDSGANSTDNNFYNGMELQITDGACKNQGGIITGYVASTRVATMTSAWNTSQPDTTSKFRIKGNPDAALNNTANWLPTFSGFVMQMLFMDPVAFYGS